MEKDESCGRLVKSTELLDEGTVFVVCVFGMVFCLFIGMVFLVFEILCLVVGLVFFDISNGEFGIWENVLLDEWEWDKLSGFDFCIKSAFYLGWCFWYF